MTKPREFWIRETTLVINDRGINGKFEFNDCVHVREVVPIDWEKVWKEFEHWTVYCQMIGVDNPKLKIQSLVEKQLAGEE